MYDKWFLSVKALGATIGRLPGPLTKIPIALTIWITLSVAVFWK